MYDVPNQTDLVEAIDSYRRQRRVPAMVYVPEVLDPERNGVRDVEGHAGFIGFIEGVYDAARGTRLREEEWTEDAVVRMIPRRSGEDRHVRVGDIFMVMPAVAQLRM